MQIETIIAIGLVVVVLGLAAYVFFFRKKGRRVHAEFYEEMSSGVWYRIDPLKKYKAIIYRDVDNIEKLRIPRKFSKVPIEGVNIDTLFPTNSAVPLLSLVRDAEGLFRPMKLEIFDRKTFRSKVEQREPMSWLFQESERIMRDYAAKDWFAKYGAMVMVGIIVIGGLLTIWVTADKINELNDDYRAQVLNDVREQKSWVSDLVNNINGKNKETIETSADAQKPPTAS